MGQSGSKQTSESVSTYDDVRKTINDILASSEKTTLQSAKNSNKLNVMIKKIKPGCPTNIEQNIKSSQIEISEVTSDLASKLTEQVTKQLQQAAEGTLKKETDVIGSMSEVMGGGTDQEVINKTKTRIEDITKNTFKMKNLQKVQQEVKNANKAKIKIGVCDGPLNIKQDLLNTQMAKSLTENLSKNMKDAKLDTVLDQSASGSVSQKDVTISSITDMLGNMALGYSAVISCVLCAAMCLCVGLLVFMMSPAGQNVARQAAPPSAM